MVKLLQSAGLAVKALVQSQSNSEDQIARQESFAERKESFTAAASQYFNILSSVDVRLRREINALEEASIIPAESITKESQFLSAVPSTIPINAPNAAAAKQFGARKGAIYGGGLGSLDVGWLNSRNDSVGKEMEAELWEQTQHFVDNLENPNATNTGGKTSVESQDSRFQRLGTGENNEGMDQL